MRQTSQAVALLLSSVYAAEVNPVYGTSLQTMYVPSTQTQGETVLVKQPVYQPIVKMATAAALNVSDDNAGAVSAPGSTSCMDCIRGITESTGTITQIDTVWCSAAWNYEYKAAATYSVTSASPNTLIYNKDGTSDSGACCYSAATMAALTGVTYNSTGVTIKVNKLLNRWQCPAKFDTDWEDAAVPNATGIVTTTPWWCSDGSYNMIASADYGTASATPNSYGATTSLYGSSYTPVIDKNDDRRVELFAASCRQKIDICGAGFVDGTTAGTAMLRSLSVANDATGFSSSEKCSWYLESLTKAPTFSISNVTANKELTDKYDVIYQEWVEGWQLAKSVDYIEKIAAISTQTSVSGLVFPHLLDSQYAKAAKYNYKLEENQNWAAQSQGDAWYYNQQKLSTACDIAAVVDFTSGTTADCFDTTTPGKALARQFNVSGASSAIKNAEATLKTFNGLANAFNTSAASYNTYLADLKIANEKDAFSAFFSPPVKPKFVKRASPPTVPATYTGMQHWSTAKQQNFWNKKGSGVPTLNTEFIVGNLAGKGGWGAWTISRINGGYSLGDTNPLWHSFGLLGVQQGVAATPLNTMSWAKGWQQNNEDPSFLIDLYNSHTNTGFITCGNTAVQTSTSNTCPFLDNVVGAGVNIAVNTKKTYLTVSLWAADATVQAASSFDLDFTIQFYASEWATTGYYAPKAGTALTALSEPAAAQALAATAAAALAVAAALY